MCFKSQSNSNSIQSAEKIHGGNVATSKVRHACLFRCEPPDISKGPELELFCLAAHMSSRGPGIEGVTTVQSA